MRGFLVMLGFLILVGSSFSQDTAPPPRPKRLAPKQLPPPAGAPEQAPAPTPVNPLGWTVDPKTGEWTDPEGSRWRFDGLRWQLQWTDKQWYPVVAPGPLPLNWPREGLGQGWTQVLPPNTSVWHVVPPSTLSMPPPFNAPPPPYIFGVRYTGMYGVGRRRWR